MRFTLLSSRKKSKISNKKKNNNVLIKNNIIKRDAYFLSKIFNEKIIQLSNINYLILRPHNIYGPRMGFSHVIPELIKKDEQNKKKEKKIKYLFFLQGIKEHFVLLMMLLIK